MKSVLVPMQLSGGFEAALRLACILARKYDSYVEAFPVRHLPHVDTESELLGAPPPDAYLDLSLRISSMQEAVQSEMLQQGIPPASLGYSSPSFGWSGIGRTVDLGVKGRIFDVTVVGRPGPDATGPLMSTLESALFDSGRPILIAPELHVRDFGKKIVVAWNGSAEASRTVAFARPLMTEASQVLVLTVEVGSIYEPTGEDVALYLRRAGMNAHAISVPARRRTVGEAILEEASKLGADLLVKGAYTQSRLRQMIFGGATRHILENTKLPVVMAH